MTTLLIERLRELLDFDLQRGTISWNELGTVNRAEYARRHCVSPRALPLEAFAKYDDLGPRPISKADALRSMLDNDYRNEALVITRPGVLNKLHYGKAIGFVKRTASRAAEGTVLQSQGVSEVNWHPSQQNKVQPVYRHNPECGQEIIGASRS